MKTKKSRNVPRIELETVVQTVSVHADHRSAPDVEHSVILELHIHSDDTDNPRIGNCQIDLRFDREAPGEKGLREIIIENEQVMLNVLELRPLHLALGRAIETAESRGFI